MTNLGSGWILSLAAFMVCQSLAALAGDAAQLAPVVSQPSTDEVSQLRSLLDTQQRRIEQLEQRLAGSQQGDVEQARIDEMRRQIREILSEEEFRESLMPSTLQAGYDKGFYIRSSDELFMIKLNGMMQFRYTYYHSHRDNRYLAPGYRRSDRSGFDINRLRLRFSGHAYSKDLTYWIELDSGAPNEYDTRLFYAWFNYRFADELQFKFGRFRTANLRADFASVATMQFVEYPMMNSVFGLGDGTGVRLWGQLFKKKLDYYVDLVNTLGGPNTRTITNDEDFFANGHDGNPAVVARLVWHALTGDAKTPVVVDQHMDSPSDVEFHMDPALDVGMHYAFSEDWQDGTLRIPFPSRSFRTGGFGLTSSDGLQIHQIGVDSAFKWRGFSISGEYVLRILDVRNSEGPFATPLYQLTGDGSTNVQHGGYVQAGYFLPIPKFENKLEVVGRVGGVSALSGGLEGMWEYAGGINYHIDGHRVKLQFDVTKVTESPTSSNLYSLANVNDDALIFRVQMQVAF